MPSIRLQSAFLSLALGMMSWGVNACSAEDENQVLKFGITPREAPRIMYQKFTPLADYLSKELGMKVELVVGKDFQASIDALGKNTVQVALLTPSAYPKCEKMYPDAAVKPLVRFVSAGKGTYKACIFVPSNSSLNKLAELKGKKFAFGDATSAASNLMPRAMLKAEGIDVEKDLLSYKYLGSHTNVAAAVAASAFEAGACMDSVAERFEKDGKVRIIARSVEMPDAPICGNKHLPPHLVGKLAQALLKLNSNDATGKSVLTPINDKYTGCEPADAKDYDSIRQMATRLYGDAWHTKAL